MLTMSPADNIPLIDIAPLVAGSPAPSEVAEQLGQACREHGFFYISGTASTRRLCTRLESLSREFFAREH